MKRTLLCSKNKVYRLMAIVLLLFLMGVGYFIWKNLNILPEKLPEKPQYNAAVKNSEFLKVLEKFKILAVVPSSAPPSSENIQQLKEIPSLNIVLPDEYISDAIPYTANTDEKRFEFLKNALVSNDPSTIIWTVRGGYGAGRLIDDLEKMTKPELEKIFIGFSDITVLHLFLSQKWGWKTIHGPVLLDMLTLTIEKDPKNLEKVADLISGKVKYAELTQLLPLNTLAENSNTISGRITGGNLTMVQSSIGTSWQIDTKGKILFLEDIGNKGYQIDRMLTQLKQAGLFKGAKAIVFGYFKGADEFNDFALNRFAQEVNIPVYKTDEFGHGEKNYPLIYNAESTLSKSENSEFFILKMGSGANL